MKTAIVTGASRGIGKVIALHLAKEGYHLLICCSAQKEELEKTQKEILFMGVDCLTFVGDMGDYQAVAQMFSHFKARYTHLDLLVNNAGISYIGLFTDMKETDWNHILSTNLNSVINCCHCGLPLMTTQHKGKIINISSVWGTIGASCEVIYSASKGAVNTFTKALAKEMAPSNITVNAIACGVIDTAMNSCFSKEEREALADEIPSSRFGTPSEVAELVLSLATAPDYLTGQIITLDGGWT